jgi:ectoine hydroxylase-related dioxygenase (phytanoyl-CoA dioxygenase family)
MTSQSTIPNNRYGILHQNETETAIDEAVEQVQALGFAVLDGGYSNSELKQISDEYDQTLERYIEKFGEERLRDLHELHTMRALLTHEINEKDRTFLRLALNENLLSTLKRLIPGNFILNQQNGVINPPQETYNQGSWHRDLPYQHYLSSKPLAVNALFCVDDFVFENGSTFVLPASHKIEPFPSEGYIKNNAVQVEVKAGSYVLLDCMIFHSGGFNRTDKSRRAVNNVYTIPYMKQQICLPPHLQDVELTADEKNILAFNYMEPQSIEAYFENRVGKGY